jgi:hypothetical protein
MTFNYVGAVNFKLPDTLIEEVKTEIPVPRKLGIKNFRKQTFQKAFKEIAKGNIESTVFKFNGIEYQASKEDLLDLQQRLDKNNPNWKTDIAFFIEKPLSLLLQEKIKLALPIELQQLNPVSCIQTKFGRFGEGSSVPPHRDHYRTATLWYLLEGYGETTSWWEPTDYFQEYDFWQIADISKIAQVHSQVLDLEKWYVFDNHTYHSVGHLEDVKKRSSLCIEFDNITAKELYNLVEKIYD